MYSLSFIASPVIGYFMINRGLLSLAGAQSLAKFGITCFIILASSYCFRGYGRFTNAEYKKFLKILLNTKKPESKHTARQQLALYDFEFSSWPVDFYWNETEDTLDRKKFNNIYNNSDGSFNLFQYIFTLPLKIARYVVAHYFARPLIYPGSIKMLQNAMAPALNDGRSKLIAKGGWRAKLKAEDGNEIDSMFIDNRSNDHGNGQILVIGCEGNAAFYEVGTIETPLNDGYSVLGWNHPGFAGSSGLPYPIAEQNAIDVVMKYAMNRLGFPVENIVLFAWSIGGYSSSWLAMMYPDVKALILDATFDRITPLAVERMPEIMTSFTQSVVHDYFPLYNDEHVKRYSGPILLYRRTRDEIISTVPYDIKTNRGNFLLVELLKSRYPNLISESTIEKLSMFLSAENIIAKQAIIATLEINYKNCEMLMKSYQEENGKQFPCFIGENYHDDDKKKMLIFLASRYMIDVDVTHCTPLPKGTFQIPGVV
ncbi:phosphatidylserine lipase ABHD16A-like isoform X2 [Xenia sp. Carnegie-2017]|nr:phosphatidylserine lipase ABHD16A-like isoform X2 [Xenia sp. Carnegie-2017]